MTVRLKLHKISKAFGNNQILSQIDLSIKSGEVLALLGDNGAGKSTLIKIISGFHSPSQGSLFWEGSAIDPKKFNPKYARHLGIQTVYQHLGLIEKLSITRNFFLGRELKIRKWGLARLDLNLMREIVNERLREMKIARRLNPDLSVGNLSGGEKQAIAIARACYFGAKLLILDEPTSSLSLNQTQELLKLIQSAKDQGISVIFITHTLHHIKDIVDSVCIINKGNVVANLKSPIDEQVCARLITQSAFS